MSKGKAKPKVADMITDNRSPQPRYNVLWLDDNLETQREFRENAAEHGLVMRGFRTLDDGIESLEDNLTFYDAILLDTTFFMDRDDELSNRVSKSIKALSHAVDKINQLASKKLLPYYIFTSNPDYENDKTFMATYENIYRKYVPEDITRLFADIRNQVRRETDAMIRNKYSEVFDAFTKRYIGEAHQKALFEVLKNYENPDALINNNIYFNPLRKILEAIFVALNKYGVIPNSCFKGQGEPNIMYCSLYMSGKEVRLSGGRFTKAKEKYFPRIIQNNVWNIVSYTNIGSHNEVPTKLEGSEISELRASGVNSPYLLYVLTFEMLDVIIWTKAFIDNNFVNNRQFMGRSRR